MIEKRHISFRDETTKTEDTNFILNLIFEKNILIKHKQNLTLFPLVAYAYIYIIYYILIYISQSLENSPGYPMVEFHITHLTKPVTLDVV